MRFLQWLSIFRKKDILDLYPVKDRTIFRYWDGAKQRSADPLVLYKRVMEIGPELSIDIKVANSVSKDAGKAYTSVVNKLRSIFEVTEYKEGEGGLTEMEVSVLFDEFMVYCGQIKKKAKSSPTSLKETSAVSNPSPEESPPTSSGLDSGSIADESNIDKPPL